MHRYYRADGVFFTKNLIEEGVRVCGVLDCSETCNRGSGSGFGHVAEVVVVELTHCSGPRKKGCLPHASACERNVSGLLLKTCLYNNPEEQGGYPTECLPVLGNKCAKRCQGG